MCSLTSYLMVKGAFLPKTRNKVMTLTLTTIHIIMRVLANTERQKKKENAYRLEMKSNFIYRRYDCLCREL